MGLLDSVLGAVTAANRPTQAGANENGLGSLIGMLASNPQLLQVISSMLANDGGQGGLGGLMAKFQQAGLGDVVGSWVGSGQNQPISGDQLSDVLGSDAMSDIAARLGMNSGDVASQLSQVLPGLVDQLTPQGAAPANGLGNADDLFGMLGGLLQK
ncbi:MAG TPA: YidB family protein [Burkholderiaceae bacterium]|nr:YidB family protein [Burkholderiaceae bacterium]